MIFSLQGKNNAEEALEIEKLLVAKLLIKNYLLVKNDNHKFQPNQKAELVGLVDYPQFNGEIVTITSIRENGKFGKAYYFSTDNIDLSNNLNWTYEYRLKEVNEN